MRLETLTVRNFRNIVSLDVEFPPEGVVIVGENGQGKTSLLEAIFYLVLFRSMRGSRDRELVKFEAEGFYLAGQSEARIQAGYEIAGARKKVSVDGNPVARLGHAVGRFVAIPFSPSDRAIVTEGPGERRKFMDVLLSLVDRGYLEYLSDLRAVLRQRNAALRRNRPDEASAFDEPYVRAAEYVIRARREWVGAWQGRYRELCLSLGESGVPSLEYSPRREGPETAEMLAAELAIALDRDLTTGSTGHGPHRHDLRVMLDAKELRHYGSGGQQRTAALALRMLEVEVLKEKTGRRPVTMYDDIFAELDSKRQQLLLRMIEGFDDGQVILTAPRDSEIPPEMFDRPRWTIAGGRLET